MPADWAPNFFRAPIFDPGQPEARERAAAEARFVARVLGLRRSQRLLDVCCGAGRHHDVLRRRGVDVVGVDVTKAYLRQARRAGAWLVRADMARLPFLGAFDAAMNLWTSFGYLSRPSADVAALRQIRLALRPGGLLLLDTINGAWLRLGKNFKREQRLTRPDGAVVCERARLIGGRDPRVESEWTILRRGRAVARAGFSIRIYDRGRLEAALRSAGLKPVRRWGGFDGRRCSARAQRLIVLARRPI